MQRINIESFGIGIVVGVALTILLFGITVRILGRRDLPPTIQRSGMPEVTIALNRDLLQRLIDDSLRDVSIPLVTLRDPTIALEPGGVLVIRLRGDTILLGAQPIVLRLQLTPAETGVAIHTTSADVGLLGDIAGPLTNRLDQKINAELARRLAFADQFEVLNVDGTTEDVIVTARLRD